VITVSQLAAALYGVWLLIRLDPRAFSFFEKTPEGFARSFLPAVVIMPLQLAHEILIYSPAKAHLAFAPYVVVQLLSSILSWVAFPFAMLYVSELLNRRPRYFWHIIPYNWFQLAAGLLFLPLAILADLHMIAGRPAAFLNLLALGVFFTFATFIARGGLQVGFAGAIGVVMVDLMLNQLIQQLVSKI
jgi:hypothetical protein